VNRPQPQPRFRRLRVDVEPGPRVATCCGADDAEPCASRRHHTGLDHVGRRLDLLGQPALQANHLAAKRLPGQNLVLTGLLAGKLAEAGSGHGNMRTRFVFVLPGLSATQQGLAMLGPGEMRLGRDLTEHHVGRADGRRLGGNNGNGPIISALRYPRRTSRAGTGAMERRGHARFPERPVPGH
jgi:hypothetical protein